MEMDPRQFEDFTEAIADAISGLRSHSAAAEDVAKSLNIEDSLRKASTRTQREKNEAEREAARIERTKAQGWRELGKAGHTLLSSFTTTTQAVYTSEKAFSAVTPVLDLMASTTKSVVVALGKVASGVPVLGGLFETGGELIGAGIDLFTGVLKQQIENSQRMVDNFDKLSKLGVTFGGDIYAMQRSAMEAGISVDTMTKFVTANASSLNSLGSSITNGTIYITKMGKTIKETDSTLFALYGGFEGLNTAVAEYAAMQSRYGISGTRLNKDLEGSARAYLYQQKELAELTGKSVDQAKKEAEERAKDAAYQISMNKLTATERLNTEEAMQQISAKYGAAAAQYAKEFVSTGGKVISQSGIMFEKLSGPVGDSIRSLLGTTSQTQEEFRKTSTETISKFAPAVKEFALSQETFAKLQQAGVANEVIKMMSDLASATIATSGAQEGAAQAAKDLTKSKADADKSAIELYASALTGLENFKRGMDKLTMDNFENTAETVRQLYEMSMTMYGIMEHGTPIMTKFYESITRIVNTITGAGASKVGLGPTSALGAETDIYGGGEATPSAGTSMFAGKKDMVQIMSRSGASAWVHKEQAGKFQSLIDYMDSTGYQIKTLGGYNPRDVRGKPGVPSVHSWGGALDINAAENPMGSSLETNMRADIVAKAKELGLGWGGDWKSRKDPMHFSADPKEGAEKVSSTPSTVTADANPRALIEAIQELIGINKDIRDSNEQILHASA